MSIQSTRYLTREDAELKYIQLQLSNMSDIKRQIRLKASSMSNEELENAIEETFYNYSIREPAQELVEGKV